MNTEHTSKSGKELIRAEEFKGWQLIKYVAPVDFRARADHTSMKEEAKKDTIVFKMPLQLDLASLAPLQATLHHQFIQTCVKETSARTVMQDLIHKKELARWQLVLYVAPKIVEADSVELNHAADELVSYSVLQAIT
jgi:hypothetical protein